MADNFIYHIKSKKAQVIETTSLFLNFKTNQSFKVMQTTKEEWKPVNNFPSYYVSNHGRVKNLDGTILKKHFNHNGYHRVCLYKSNVRHAFFVHKLVALHFIEFKPEINHIDGNKLNNHVSNLEWCTRSENVRHSFSIGLQSNKGTNNPAAKLNYELVREIRDKFSTKKYTKAGLAREYNVGESTIRRVVTMTHWIQ